jgi:tetratricopeptide (TPR) repeat protein
LFAIDQNIDELERLAHETIPLLEKAHDHAGLVHVCNILAYGVDSARGRFADMERDAERALDQARLAGWGRPGYLAQFEAALYSGPRPADEALARLESLLPENPHPSSLILSAGLHAMLTHYDESSRIARGAGERFRELTGDDSADVWLGDIAATVGDHATAVDHLRRACALQDARGERAALSTYAPAQGRSLCALGRYAEAEPLAQLGRDLGNESDVITQVLWRQVQAVVHASRGEHTEAERLAREAVERTDETDAPNWQGDALFDLA